MEKKQTNNNNKKTNKQKKTNKKTHKYWYSLSAHFDGIHHENMPI